MQYQLGMPQRSWMIERLDEGTRLHHAEADADREILFHDDAAPADYLIFLMRVYGFEAPLESALAMTPDFELVLDLRERHKASYLAQDMLAIGLRPHEVAEMSQCLTIPQFASAAEALGWMFVVERATLAHGVIRRHLLTKLPREMTHASAYLQRYEGVVETRWRQFGAVLDDVAHHPAVADRIVVAANDAFRGQRRWVAHQHEGTHAEAV